MSKKPDYQSALGFELVVEDGVSLIRETGADDREATLEERVLWNTMVELLEALQMWMAIHDTPAGFAGKFGRELDAAIAAQQVKVSAAANSARAAIAKATGGAA